MFLAVELQTSGVYVSLQPQGLFTPSKSTIRVRKIALRDENDFFSYANRRRPARTAREWPNHRENALEFVERDKMESETPRRLHSNRG